MVGLAFALVALQATTTSSFGYQDFNLGAPIEAFRARSLSPGQYGPRRTICSDNPEAPNWLQLRVHHAAAGVIKCGWQQRVGRNWVREGLPISSLDEYAFELNYYEGRLYQIELFADVELGGSIRSRLTARFGRPRGAATVAVQDSYREQYPQQLTTWSRGRYSVTMIVPTVHPERLAVIYTDTEAEARIEAIARSRNRTNN